MSRTPLSGAGAIIASGEVTIDGRTTLTSDVALTIATGGTPSVR